MKTDLLISLPNSGITIRVDLIKAVSPTHTSIEKPIMRFAIWTIGDTAPLIVGHFNMDRLNETRQYLIEMWDIYLSNVREPR